MNQKQDKVLKMLLNADALINDIDLDIKKINALNNTISNVFFDLDPKSNGCYILFSFDLAKTMNSMLLDYISEIYKNSDKLCKALNQIVDTVKEN